MSQIIDKTYGKTYGMELKCLRELEKDLKTKKVDQPLRRFRRYTMTIRLDERTNKNAKRK